MYRQRTTNLFLLIVFHWVCSSGIVLSQEKMGIENSNYSSTNSIFLNPSSSVDSRTFIQMNLIGANVYAITNQIYLPDFSVWKGLKGYDTQAKVVYNDKKKFFYGNVALDAPSIVVSHQRIGAGFFVRGRSVIDIRNVPYQFTDWIIPDLIDSTAPSEFDFDYRNVKFSNLSWAEFGVNLGTMVRKRNGALITAGANLKYLNGINLFYTNLDRVYAYISDPMIDIKKLKGRARGAQVAWGAGKGFGTDLGITYRKALDPQTEYEGYYVNSKRSDCNCIDYLYKAGISLLDLGYIRFKSNTYKASIDGSAYIADHNEVKSVDSLIEADFDPSIERDVPVTATLPTALSAQLDLNLSHHVYLNGTIIKGIVPDRVTGPQRANQLSITPRYERRQFEIAVPFTLHRFVYPQLGLAFRFRSFVLGTDQIVPFIMAHDTYSMNLYFNLGISLFKNPACKVKHHKKKKEKVKKWVTNNCPKFSKRNILGF